MLNMKRGIVESLSNLQEYGSSDSDEEDSPPKNYKRLPAPILPNYSDCRSIMREPTYESDIKTIRNFPHEPGNWATYIYAPITQTYDLIDYVTELSELIPSVELNPVEDFHISVTRTVILRYHWIKDFTNSVNEVLVNMNPFFINLTGFKVYLNENKTRTFIGLKVGEGSKELKEIVNVIDYCLEAYQLPPFYKPPSFHVSLLWCVGDKSKEINDRLISLPNDITTANFFEKICCLKCNCGNKIFNFNFIQDKKKNLVSKE